MLRKVAVMVALFGIPLAVAHAEDARSLATQALAAYQSKNYAECGRLYAASVEKGNDDEIASYDGACCFALIGEADRAFALLERALQAGYHNADHLQQDTDWNAVHADPRWQAMVRKTQRADEVYKKSINTELAQMSDEDQADRRTTPINWDVVGKRDDVRRARVLEMIAAKQLKASDDYYNAALVMQHGLTAEDYDLAHQLASKAVAIKPNNRGARWLACAAKDRWLWATGKPQIYGTQFEKKDADSPWTIEPIDRAAVTDEERLANGVPTLAETQQRLDERNAPK